jgi:hypothetical protein
MIPLCTYKKIATLGRFTQQQGLTGEKPTVVYAASPHEKKLDISTTPQWNSHGRAYLA